MIFIPEIGTFSLIIALNISIFLGFYSFYSIDNKIVVEKSLTLGLVFFISISYLILTICFIQNNFSVLYVAKHSSTLLPLIYRVTAVWGGHEGSMLLWVLIFALWMLSISNFSQSIPELIRKQFIGTLAWIFCGLMLFLLVTSNPFARLFDIPSEGLELNPLLQDPGFIIHPPILYMGYVGFSIPFAIATVTLRQKQLIKDFYIWIRPWALCAWAFLTLGIVLGSWWAYRELGWGGWWFWDPVENASLLPWLAGTGLIHSLIVNEKRQLLLGWSLFLSIITFILCILGTFFVRSGLLTSVHNFVNDPSRGLFMLGFIFILVCYSLVIFITNSLNFKVKKPFNLFSRESILIINNVMLLVLLLCVFLGTFYPLLLDTLGLGKISVGAPYFNNILKPIVIPLVFLMALTPHIKWSRTQIEEIYKKVVLEICVSIFLAVIFLKFTFGYFQWFTLVVTFLSLWLIVSTLKYFIFIMYSSNSTHYIKLFSMVSGHIGVAVLSLGICISESFSLERYVKIDKNYEITIGQYKFFCRDISEIHNKNFTGISIIFDVFQNEKQVSSIVAEKRLYTVSKTLMTDAGIDSTVFRDLYISLGEQLSNGVWTAKFYYKPFISWIWVGGFLIFFGGILSGILKLKQFNMKLLLK